MVRHDEAHPQWVLIDGELHDVSEFVCLPPRSRPDVICPVCANLVTMKLGTERVHHYAHQPGQVCITTQPETALHLNVKFYIYHQLLKTDRILIEQECAGHCDKTKQSIWLQGWDRLEVEYTVSSFRPDIALVKDEKVIGAIEVVVTHRMEEPKREYFEEQEIKWLEIDADESLYQGDGAWKTEDPLQFTVCHPDLEKWICDDCLDRQREAQERREYERHNYTEIHATKMVDFYFPSGKKHREVYYVMKRVENDQWVRAWVKTEKNRVVASQKGPITPESLKLLSQAVARELDKRRRQRAIVDDFMEWRRWVAGQKFVPWPTPRFPFRYYWQENVHKWIFCEEPDSDWVSKALEESFASAARITTATKQGYEWEPESVEEQSSSPDSEPSIRPAAQSEEGICIFCGKRTTDWWFYESDTGMCRCTECYRTGKF